MSQGTLQVANQGFPGFRTDLNAALSALNSKNSGTSAPSALAAGQAWLDTATGTRPVLKQYDGADWLLVTEFDTNANESRPYAGTGVFGRHPALPVSGTSPDFGSTARQWGTGHFAALQIGTSGEALATYDEGTFTAALSLGGGTASLTESTLKYVKIGSMVHITGRLTVNTASTPSGSLTITGLPFTVFNAVSNLTHGTFVPQNWGAGLTTAMSVRAVINTTTATVYMRAATGGYVTTNVANNLANSCDMEIGLTYFTV